MARRAGAGGRARLPVGELRLAPGVPFALDAGGFDRHTFFCGQSGSGKTYSLGVVLEQLLLETSLRIVILDPNSDMTRLARGARRRRRGRPRSAGARSRTASTSAAGTGDAAPLRAAARAQPRGAGGDAAARPGGRPRGARRARRGRRRRRGPESLEDLVGGARPEARALAHAHPQPRHRPLGRVGAPTPASRRSPRSRDARCLVLDLGSLDTREEQALVAGAVLGTLWERRAERQPVLIVIDEAHNVCPSDPPDALTALATDYAVRIAAEGRKFGALPARLHAAAAEGAGERRSPSATTSC